MLEDGERGITLDDDGCDIAATHIRHEVGTHP